MIGKLRHQGVTEFATRNETHFAGFGFTSLGIFHRKCLARPSSAWDNSNMKYTGKVRDGVVVLEGSPFLKDGTIVAAEPLGQPGQAATLGQRFQRFSGSAQSLPRDMARNHDHYLHGRPKR